MSGPSSVAAPGNVLCLQLHEHDPAGLYIAFNPHSEPVNLTLPQRVPGLSWVVALDSARDVTSRSSTVNYVLEPMSAAVFEGVRTQPY